MGKNVLKDARRRAAAAKAFDKARDRALVRDDGVYLCERCGQKFKASWTDAEARDEALNLFGDMATEPQSIVCSLCFHAMRRAGVFPS